MAVGVRAANKAGRFASRRRALGHQGQIGYCRTDRQAVRNDDYAWHGLTGLHAFEGEKWSEGLDEVVARAVFGALEAAGCDGGRQVEGRKSTNPQVPTGTTEVVRFQPWVASERRPEPRPPSRRSGALARREGGRGKEKMGLDWCVLSSLTGLVNLLREEGVIPSIVLEMKSHGIEFHTA